MAATSSFNASKLYDRLLRFGYLQKRDETRKKIIQMLNSNENGIAMDRMKMSLKCPITKTLMNVPVLSATCSHLQCFDLGNYLKLNEKKPTWKCPICNGNAHYDYLIIDEYILYVLNTVEGKNIDEIELSKRGTWRIPKRSVSKSKEKIITIDDNSNDEIQSHARISYSSKSKRSNAERRILRMDKTHNKIIQMLNCNENGLKMDRMKMSLKCPITKTLMQLPGRSATCSHLQCFDLENFLKLNEKKPTWKCPICNGNAHCDYLIIDEYIFYMLKTVEDEGNNVDEVELLQHGGFRVVSKSKENIITIDDDSNNGFERHARNMNWNIQEASGSTGSKSKTYGRNNEVITIDDDSNNQIQRHARIGDLSKTKRSNAESVIRILSVSATASFNRVTRRNAHHDL